MATEKRYRLLSAIAGAAAVLALGASLILAQGGDTAGPDRATQAAAMDARPASSPTDPDAGRPVEECRLKVVKAVVDVDSDLRDLLEGASVRVGATAPATPINVSRVVLAPRVSVFVTCDLRQGVVGLRGGVSLSGDDETVDIRRWRVDTSSGRIEAYLSADGKAPSYALHASMKKAKRNRDGTRETINVPVRIAEGGAAVVNHAFGTGFRNRDTTFGTLRLTVERIET